MSPCGKCFHEAEEPLAPTDKEQSKREGWIDGEMADRIKSTEKASLLLSNLLIFSLSENAVSDLRRDKVSAEDYFYY